MTLSVIIAMLYPCLLQCGDTFCISAEMLVISACVGPDWLIYRASVYGKGTYSYITYRKLDH
jgi:hypothetical protein